jgi:selenocysteine-specific elongation factor
MHVIATAGHVDHGKSTLVRSLTGMEPDRWAEERRRGMTIDLGYAWATLPSGEEIAFVDVPGHERFTSNMLAGVGPVPAVMLVIAADGGWASQTAEHVRALDAFGVRHGLVAVTRSDIADPASAIVEAEERLTATTLAGIPAVAVSGITGEGLPALRSALATLASRLPVPNPATRVRFWVDRCFTIRGSGTVVTGTLGEGTLRRGETLELNGRPVVVRGLQCLGQPVEHVSGTARVAINLRGVTPAEVHRGNALLTPGAWLVSDLMDVRCRAAVLPTEAVLHVGSAAVAVRVQRLGGGGGDDEEVIRLHLGTPLPTQVGDRILLRHPGRRLVLGGATVLDPAAPTLVRRGAARKRAAALADDTGTPDLLRELRRRGAAREAFLSAIGVRPPHQLPTGVVRAGGWLVEQRVWDRWLEALDVAVVDRPVTALLEAGVGRAELVRGLGLPDSSLLAALLAASPDIEQKAGYVRRRGANAMLRPDVATAVGRLALLLRDHPFDAPGSADLAAMGLGPRELGAAAAAGAILRLPGEIVLLPDAPLRAAEILRTVQQPFTLSSARSALGTTRRVAVPLFEHMDGLRLTERVDTVLRRLRPRSTNPH